MKRFLSFSNAKGMSLLELLSVIAIIAILTSLVLAASNSVSGAANLKAGGDFVAARMNLARQLALTESREIELRFLSDAAAETENPRFSAIQIIRYREKSPVDKIDYLPSSATILSDRKFSTLLSAFNPWSEDATMKDPRTGKSLRFKSYVIYPDGTTNLSRAGAGPDHDEWFVTLRLVNAGPTGQMPGTNFITIKVDPVTARTRVYQPR